jgi:hypothetical protein
MKKTLIIVVAAVTAVGLAPIANADTTGTVKARTQRTSAPNLASQTGWWEVGTPVDLQCSTPGQAVKGFFSFNIPNGGWDNMWYRTPSGDYVADVDIETGTLNSVTPSCADFDKQNQPPPPEPKLGLLGGVDVAGWCRDNSLKGGDPAPADPNNAYSWHCRSADGVMFTGVNMDGACARQYGPGAYAKTFNDNDPYSWRCYRG